MKWFKHMAHMSEDVKIKRLIKQFGVEGYGLYNYVLELIVRKMETESPLPELEETAHDLAYDLKMDTLRVEEIIRFCINQGLFEQNEVDGKVMARKVYKFLDGSTTRSAEMKAMIANFNHLSRTVQDNHRLSVPEQNRIEQNRKEESTEEQQLTDQEIVQEPKKKRTSFTKPSLQEVKDYCIERRSRVDAERFIDHYESNGWMVGKTKMKDWRAAVRTWERNTFTNKEEPVRQPSKPSELDDITKEIIARARNASALNIAN